MIVSESSNTRVNYFISDPYEHNIQVRIDTETNLPYIMIDGEIAFQVLIANDFSKGQRCNVAICHENVDDEIIKTVIRPMICGNVDVIQIKEKR